MQNKEFQLVPYDLEVATIEGLKAKYMDITIPPEDKAAYAMVMSGLRECRNLLKDADDWHKGKKALILKAGRHYDGEKNRVHALVEPIQDHLKAVRKVEDDRVEAIQAEKIRVEEERVDGIRAKIEKIKNYSVTSLNTTSTQIHDIIEMLNDTPITIADYQEFQPEAIQALETTLRGLMKAKADRVKWEQAQAAAKAESERLEKVCKEQEAEAAKLKAAQDKIDKEARKVAADKAALEAEKAAEAQRKRQAEFEKQALKTARITAERNAIEKVAREAREAKDKADAEAAEKVRKAALAPDRDKIFTWARELNQRLLDMRPDLSSPEAKRIIDAAEGTIDISIITAVQKAKEL